MTICRSGRSHLTRVILCVFLSQGFVLLLLAYFIRGRSEPATPAATTRGCSPEYDRLLDALNERWGFIFADEDMIIATDIHGSASSEILRSHQLPPEGPYRPLGTTSLSPDGSRLLVTYFSSNTPRKGEFRKLALLDITSGSATEVFLPQIAAPMQGDIPGGAFELDAHLIHWLSPNSFLLSFTHCPDGAPQKYQTKFILFDLRQLDSPHELVFPVRRPVIHAPHGSGVVLFASADVPPSNWVVQALDGRGFRQATADEAQLFSRAKRGEGMNGPHELRVERVPLSFLSGLDDKRYDPDRSRFDIYLAGRWVRRTEGGRAGDLPDPRWHTPLGLYVWGESTSSGNMVTFLMDAEGRYRRWRTGCYIGAIPKAVTERRANTR